MTQTLTSLCSIAIVAHTQRIPAAEKLRAKVGAEKLPFYDDGLLGCDGNHLRALRWHAEQGGAQWALTFEDDALPVDDFPGQLQAALNAAPDVGVLSFYLGRLRPPQYQNQIKAAIDRAEQSDACWIIGPRLMHAVAYAVKTDLIRTLLAYPTTLPIDQRVSSWARQITKTQVAYSCPSLVDHDDSKPTVIVRHHDKMPRQSGRVAWKMGGRETWTTQAVTLMP